MRKDPPHRVLLVDDEPANLALLEAVLGEQHFALRSVTSGEAALAAVADWKPDLVLLDVAMPGMSGIDVLARLRTGGAVHLPVIMVTAHTDRERRLCAMDAGADEMLEKPIDVAMLLVRVRTLLALKASRDELAERTAALEALQREQRELMELIVHDLRSPLMVAAAGIAYASEAFAEEPAQSREALRDASTSLDRMNDLVGDLLTVSRLERAELSLQIDSLDVSSLVSSLERRYQRKAAVRAIAIHSSASPATLQADRGILQRVLENILDNSLRHTPSSGQVSIVCERRGDRVVIAVSNNGPPIPIEEREAVFDKFVRGRSPSSRPGSAGLGLYFCRRAIEAHGGRIHVEQTEIWPTRFVIELPIAA